MEESHSSQASGIAGGLDINFVIPKPLARYGYICAILYNL
jgi:hypothetical protein